MNWQLHTTLAQLSTGDLVREIKRQLLAVFLHLMTHIAADTYKSPSKLKRCILWVHDLQTLTQNITNTYTVSDYNMALPHIVNWLQNTLLARILP